MTKIKKSTSRGSQSRALSELDNYCNLIDLNSFNPLSHLYVRSLLYIYNAINLFYSFFKLTFNS